MTGLAPLLGALALVVLVVGFWRARRAALGGDELAAMTLAGEIASGALGEIVGCSTVIRLWRPQSYYDEPGRGSFARDGGGVDWDFGRKRGLGL